MTMSGDTKSELSDCQIQVLSLLKTDHRDLIHDVALDYYGKRMATCSSDQSVKIWNQNSDGKWEYSAKWKTHGASVWKVTWAHPKYGQLIATASFDRTAAVWEEVVRLAGETHWVRRATFVESRTSITDVKFCPKHLGLQLATASADGYIRLYENIGASDLSRWQLQHEIRTKFSICSCLAWCDSLLHSTMIAVGCDDESDDSASREKLVIYYYDEVTRKWQTLNDDCKIYDPIYDISFAPSLGRSNPVLAIASKDVYIVQVNTDASAPVAEDSFYNLPDPKKFQLSIVAKFTEHYSRVWRLAWNVVGTTLATSGDDGYVRLWLLNKKNKWGAGGSYRAGNYPISSKDENCEDLRPASTREQDPSVRSSKRK